MTPVAEYLTVTRSATMSYFGQPEVLVVGDTSVS